MTLSILTCSPHFSSLALNELARQHPSINVLSELSPGCILLQTPVSFDRLTRPWRHHLPIYLHHMFPVQCSIPLQGRRADLKALQDIAERHLRIDRPLTIQPRILSAPSPYSVDDILRTLSGVLRAPAISEELPSKKVMSIVVAQISGAWTAYLGVSWPSQNLSPWPGGVNLYNVSMPNRAGYKLVEALEEFQIRLRPGDRALDLGAAPGAWTMVLRRCGMIVTAVAPREMYPAIQMDPMVHHQRMCAEEYLRQVEGIFDLITNDMIMDSQDSARLMVSYAAHLKPQGIAIMTLKLRERNRRRVMDHTLRLLREAYKIIRVRQLVSNQKEVTLFLRRKT